MLARTVREETQSTLQHLNTMIPQTTSPKKINIAVSILVMEEANTMDKLEMNMTRYQTAHQRKISMDHIIHMAHLMKAIVLMDQKILKLMNRLLRFLRQGNYCCYILYILYIF